MLDRKIYDNYGDWDKIAELPNIDDVKEKIGGNRRGRVWGPNFIPPAIAYIFEDAANEMRHESSSVPAIVDFGCGLGRNGPALKRFFPRVVGIDLPEMVERVRKEFPSVVQNTYSQIYMSVPDLVASEQFCTLYDSVVFQHILNREFLSDLIDRLSENTVFRNFVTVYNGNGFRFPHLDILRDKGWHIWHSEVEHVSFRGAPHVVVAFRRGP